MRISVILSLIFLVFIYVGIELSRGLGLISWIALGVLIAGVFFYPVLWRLPHGPIQKLKSPIQLAMALLSFVLAFTILRDLGFVALWAIKSPLQELIYTVNGGIAVWILSILSLVTGLIIVNSGPRIRKIEIPIVGLPLSLHGTKIAQISDLHVGSGIDAKFVQNVVQKVQKIAPDFIAFTGDIADGDTQRFKKNLEPLRSAFNVPMYYVPGNHEYYWNGPEWFSVFKDLGMRLLFNHHEIFQRGEASIMIAGVVDPTARLLGEKPDPQKAMNGGDADYKILLAHQPGISTEAEKLGFDLQLSGHTHGGQFFPWTLIIKGVHRHFNGLKREGRMWVYVNPGTGHWGPPVRLGTRAEITALTLVSV